MQTSIIAYVRVSTKKQGISGLGLQAQCDAINDFASKEGLDVIKIYTETESGRKDDREQLALALAHAKRLKARLVASDNSPESALHPDKNSPTVRLESVLMVLVESLPWMLVTPIWRRTW